MDVKFFLKRRTAFIRYYYAEGRKPFEEIKHKIENEIEPFTPPSFNPEYDDVEPPFLEEWMEAEMAIRVLGFSCVSMLSDTLKIYFKTLEREFGFEPTEECKKKIFKPKGFVAGYKAILTNVLDTDWHDCPVDFGLIEQIVLTRNRVQHGEHITTFDIQHDIKAICKHSRLFFVNESEKDKITDDDGFSLFGAYVEVSQQDLFKAINEVEALAEWIEKFRN